MLTQPPRHLTYNIQARTLWLGPALLSLYIVPPVRPDLAHRLGMPPTVRWWYIIWGIELVRTSNIVFLLQRRPTRVPVALIPAKLTIAPLLVSMEALAALLTIYPGLIAVLLLTIAHWPEQSDGAQLHLATIRRQVVLPAETLNRLVINRLSLFITRRQHSRPPVLRSVRGPIGVPSLAVPTLLTALRRH